MWSMIQTDDEICLVKIESAARNRIVYTDIQNEIVERNNYILFMCCNLFV